MAGKQADITLKKITANGKRLIATATFKPSDANVRALQGMMHYCVGLQEPEERAKTQKKARAFEFTANRIAYAVNGWKGNVTLTFDDNSLASEGLRYIMQCDPRDVTIFQTQQEIVFGAPKKGKGKKAKKGKENPEQAELPGDDEEPAE